MAELIDLSELQEKVILVAVSTAEEEDTPASLDELEELASTAGGCDCGQNHPEPGKGTSGHLSWEG